MFGEASRRISDFDGGPCEQLCQTATARFRAGTRRGALPTGAAEGRIRSWLRRVRHVQFSQTIFSWRDTPIFHTQDGSSHFRFKKVTTFPMSAPFLTVTAAALVDRDGRILVQKRPDGRPMAGLWEFPGGKCEFGEIPEAALIRELKEELGIETEKSCLAPACFASEPLGDRHLLLLVYVCRKWRGIAQPIEAPELKWVYPHQLHGLDMPVADKPLVGLLEALV